MRKLSIVGKGPAGDLDVSGILVPRRLIISVLTMVAVVIGGVIGYMAFGFGLVDALFETVITVTTVGYGELHNFSHGEEIFSIVLILLGVGTAGYTFSVLIETFVEGYLGGGYRRRKMEREIASMNQHVIICGWGRVGRAIEHNLNASDAEIVVIDISAQRVSTVDGPHIHGDATDERILQHAGIDQARVLITALNADADNLYVTLTGRSMRPDLFIVSRAASDQAVPKLYQAGANRVVNPQDLGGARMAALAVQPHVAEFLDVVMHDGSLDFRLEQVEVYPESPLVGQTLRSAKVHDQTGTLVLAMRATDGEFRTNPPPTAEIRPGEVLIVIGDADQVSSLRALAQDI